MDAIVCLLAFGCILIKVDFKTTVLFKSDILTSLCVGKNKSNASDENTKKNNLYFLISFASFETKEETSQHVTQKMMNIWCIFSLYAILAINQQYRKKMGEDWQNYCLVNIILFRDLSWFWQVKPQPPTQTICEFNPDILCILSILVWLLSLSLRGGLGVWGFPRGEGDLFGFFCLILYFPFVVFY